MHDMGLNDFHKLLFFSSKNGNSRHGGSINMTLAYISRSGLSFKAIGSTLIVVLSCPEGA